MKTIGSTSETGIVLSGKDLEPCPPRKHGMSPTQSGSCGLGNDPEVIKNVFIRERLGDGPVS